MVISCEKCGTQFEVRKNEIPKEGRNVQCGVCNATWFQKPFEKIKKNNSNRVSTHYFANFFLLCLLLISFVGIMETFKDDLLYNFPELDQYYKFVEMIIDKVLEEMKNLFSSFSI